MLLTLRLAFPELLRVNVCAALGVPTLWLAKVKGEVAPVRLAEGALPVPLKLTFWTLPAVLLLLSVIVTAAVRVPKVVGVNVTVTVQLLPPATGLPQVLV